MENYGKQAAIGGSYLQYPSVDMISAHDMRVKNWPEALEAEGWSESLCLRTKETEEHTLCVEKMTVILAELAGLSEHEITYVRYGSLLHDIGKIGVPEAILLKPGRLSVNEWNIMRKHTGYAYDLIYPVEYLRPCLPIPYSHHEKWDGTGYPQGLKGEEIPLPARLFAVVDVWESLSTNRVYHEARPLDKVVKYIQEQSGTHFDPQVVELFLYAISRKTHTI